MPELVYNQLLPENRSIDARTLLASLPLERASAAASRPYVLVNFIASIDGHVTVEGRSRKLGDDGDLELFRSLRERVDAVLAGTNTMSIEQYGRMLSQPERRARRAAAGRRAEPLACLVSRSGQIPTDIPLLAEPEAEVVIFSPTDPPPAAAKIHHEPLLPSQPAFTQALRVLRERYDVRTLLCEGGPTVFGALLREHLADELFLTIAPQILGPAGAGSVVASGPPLDGIAAARLLSVLERNGSLYLRYGIGRP